MEILINIIIGLALVFVVVTLVLGSIRMGGKDEASRERSNKYMRWRVYGQAVAIVALLIGFYLKSQSGA